MSTPAVLSAVKNALSPARLGTYENAVAVAGPDDQRALELYRWNAEISAAFLPVLHVCEVVIRNAVSEAVAAVYGPQWPWVQAFEISLPNPSTGFSAMRDLTAARAKGQGSTGKVIPELNFVFWQYAFTKRHDGRLWEPHLGSILPNLDNTLAVNLRRARLFQELERVRKLRNRIAHHEPIFSRNLGADYALIRQIIGYRCTTTAAWIDGHQRVVATLAAKPLP